MMMMLAWSRYELPMEAMGMLGLVKLADATGNKSYYDLSSRPLAYTIADCTLFQADYGFRDGLPTFMALAAMSGARRITTVPITVSITVSIAVFSCDRYDRVLRSSDAINDDDKR